MEQGGRNCDAQQRWTWLAISRAHGEPYKVKHSRDIDTVWRRGQIAGERKSTGGDEAYRNRAGELIETLDIP
jgi:hypothetical protein